MNLFWCASHINKTRVFERDTRQILKGRCPPFVNINRQLFPLHIIGFHLRYRTRDYTLGKGLETSVGRALLQIRTPTVSIPNQKTKSCIWRNLSRSGLQTHDCHRKNYFHTPFPLGCFSLFSRQSLLQWFTRHPGDNHGSSPYLNINLNPLTPDGVSSSGIKVLRS